MDLANVVPLAATEHVQVTCPSVLWRQIVAQEKSAIAMIASGKLKIKPGAAALNEFFDCLDTSD